MVYNMDADSSGAAAVDYNFSNWITALTDQLNGPTKKRKILFFTGYSFLLRMTNQIIGSSSSSSSSSSLRRRGRTRLLTLLSCSTFVLSVFLHIINWKKL